MVRGASGEAVSVTAARFSPPVGGGGVLDAEGRVVPHLDAGGGDALALVLPRLVPVP
jgi:hypothetical protein